MTISSSSPTVLIRFLMGIALASSVAFGQAASAVITKSFSPSTVSLNGSSILTVTVTNPNAVPLTSVQFSDVMPAGIDLITQTGGTCSTPATGGGTFSINPGTDTFSSTSNVLAAGQSCTITASVNGTILGPHVNTTSPVTSNEAPPGTAASGTLTVSAPTTVPAVSAWSFALLAILLAGVWRYQLRRKAELG
jgi:uncharacterized repeat protein (TIGR01451 family)